LFAKVFRAADEAGYRQEYRQAPLAQKHERAQRAITALERIGGSLRQSVEAAAHASVTKALAEMHQEAEHAAGVSVR
jgi:hypothetical protein